MDTIVFDIDGTLADLAHRRHFVTGGKKDWGKFFDAMVDDPPLRDVCLLAELLGDHPLVNQGAIKLFLFSGRPETHRAQTEEWLHIHVQSYIEKAEALLMRAAGDYRPDTVVKREMLEHVRGQGYDVRLVIDDRPSVCDMWRAEGLTVLQHNDGSWDAERTWAPGLLNMMVGPSGAGKSHFIKTNWDGGAQRAVVSSDALRSEITGNFMDQTANEQVFAALHALVKARIESGLLTIVDATNLRAADRRKLRDLCPADASINYFVIDRPLAEKHRDAGWRARVTVKDMPLIEYHHQRFQSGLKYILRGDDDPRVTVHDYRQYTERKN